MNPKLIFYTRAADQSLRLQILYMVVWSHAVQSVALTLLSSLTTPSVCVSLSVAPLAAPGLQQTTNWHEIRHDTHYTKWYCLSVKIAVRNDSFLPVVPIYTSLHVQGQSTFMPMPMQVSLCTGCRPQCARTAYSPFVHDALAFSAVFSGAAPNTNVASDEQEDDDREDTDSDDKRPSDSDLSAGSDNDDVAAPDELSEDEFEIEEIIEMQRPSGKAMQWLVKWQGYPLNRDDPSSWLRRSDFSTERGYDMLLEFERARKRKSSASGKRRRSAEREDEDTRPPGLNNRRGSVFNSSNSRPDDSSDDDLHLEPTRAHAAGSSSRGYMEACQVSANAHDEDANDSSDGEFNFLRPQRPGRGRGRGRGRRRGGR